MPYIPKRIYKPIEGRKMPDKNNNWLANNKDYAFYNSTTWRKFSKEYKMNNPVCMNDGCTQPSYYTDHIKPIALGGAKYDYDNLQALCRKCNASKTGKQKYKS